MNVQVRGVQEIWIDLQFFCTGTDIGECSYGGFTHHIPKLACDDQVTFSYHGGHLYRQQNATHLGNGHAHSHTHLHTWSDRTITVARCTQVLFQAVVSQSQACIGFLDDAPGRLTANGRQLPLEVAHTTAWNNTWVHLATVIVRSLQVCRW